MRHRLRVVRAHLLAWIGLLRLALSICRGKVDQVWLGDSQAGFFGTGGLPPLGIGTAGDRSWAWHLGPRLMYSISQGGLKPGLRRALRLLGRLPGHRDVVWLFSFGEIDIRCHLAPRVMGGDQLSFVGAYVAHLQELVRDLQVPFGVCVVPVPPAVKSFVHDHFPVVGTNEERLATHGVVRRRLVEETESLQSSPPVILLDLTDALAGTDGWFRNDLHFDGVHPTSAGRAAAQDELRRLLGSR